MELLAYKLADKLLIRVADDGHTHTHTQRPAIPRNSILLDNKRRSICVTIASNRVDFVLFFMVKRKRETKYANLSFDAKFNLVNRLDKIRIKILFLDLSTHLWHRGEDSQQSH